MANNPHLRFANQSSKGYGVLEAKPDELLVQLQVTPDRAAAPRHLLHARPLPRRARRAEVQNLSADQRAYIASIS